MFHVDTVRAATDQLRGVARYYGGQGDLFGTAATYYTRWMKVSATDEIKARLAAALAELHTETGYYRPDSGVDGRGYFTRGLRLADVAGDTRGIANTAWHTGLTLVRASSPNEALKSFQLGQVRLRGLALNDFSETGDARLPMLTTRLNLNSASAYALMGGRDQVARYLAEVTNAQPSRDAYEQASVDLGTARIQLDLGQLDTTEHVATRSLRAYRYRRGHIMAELVLAEIHIRPGESQGLVLAHNALDKVKVLQSVAIRHELLMPLAAALKTQPGTDTRQLARTARQLVTTPA